MFATIHCQRTGVTELKFRLRESFIFTNVIMNCMEDLFIFDKGDFIVCKKTNINIKSSLVQMKSFADYKLNVNKKKRNFTSMGKGENAGN